MNQFNQKILRLLILLLCVKFSFGQKKTEIAQEFAKPFDIKNYQNWQKRDLTEYSLFLPKNLKVEIERGDDTNSIIAKNDRIKNYIKGYRAFISFSCKEREDLELADKIFESVVFKVLPKIEERPKPDKFEISPSRKKVVSR
jgi:hypothetical protein